jgi:hypothetical protein
MSRILRRPMFRGGPINSEGTGITSGLNYQRQGYADGPDNQGVQSNDDFMNDVFMKTIYGDNYNSQDTYNDSQNTSNAPISGMQRRLEKIKSNIPVSNREINKILLEKGEINKDSSIKDVISAQRKYAEELKTDKTKTPDYSKSNVLSDVYDLYNKPVATKQGVDEDAQFDKFYNRAYKALGGEKAGTQAIYDAMLAASPGFFRGRTLTEAAPNILESINKSGALDKPQKIKQAAAELALTRQIGLEKIQEQEKARSALLNQKLAGPQTIQNDIAKIQANFKAGPNPLTITGIAPTAIKGISMSELDKNPEASAYIDKQEKGKLILVQDPNGIQHYIVVTRKDKNNKSAWSYVGQKGIGQTTNSLSPSDLAAYNSSFRSE